MEAETRLKTEVARIKKKLQIQITELEMSLDSANKLNIDLQKTIKKQSLQLTEISAHYDEVQRQLQVTLDQLSVSQRRVQALTSEVEEIRGNYESVRCVLLQSTFFALISFTGPSWKESCWNRVRRSRNAHQRTPNDQCQPCVFQEQARTRTVDHCCGLRWDHQGTPHIRRTLPTRAIRNQAHRRNPPRRARTRC